jgi:hypothetical protein
VAKGEHKKTSRFAGEKRKFPASEVPRQCALALLVMAGWRAGKTSSCIMPSQESTDISKIHTDRRNVVNGQNEVSFDVRTYGI